MESEMFYLEIKPEQMPTSTNIQSDALHMQTTQTPTITNDRCSSSFVLLIVQMYEQFAPFWCQMLQVQDFFICSCSEETSNFDELQDKNVSQKEVLRNMTAKIEVHYEFDTCIYTKHSRLDFLCCPQSSLQPREKKKAECRLLF